MNKRKRGLLLHLIIGGMILHLLPASPLLAATRYYRYPGAIHIHTTYSDGSGTFAEMAQAAQNAGLRYIIVTDHNTLQPLRDGHQRYWGQTLALVGAEISTDSGHLLALDLPASFPFSSKDAQTMINRVNSAGGFTLIAHPMAPRWRWKDWSVKGFVGMEVINLAGIIDDEFQTDSHVPVSGAALRRVLQLTQRYTKNPDATMKGITNQDVERERRRWDDLMSLNRPMIGIASVDAHARVPLKNRILKVPTYGESFESVQTYVVTLEPLKGDVEHDRRLIYSAYRNGRLYMVYPRIAPAPNFSFTAQEGDREATMGQPIRMSQKVNLVVHSPGNTSARIRLLKDGIEVASVEGKRLEWTASKPGAYRVEVYAVERAGNVLNVRRGLKLPSVKDVLNSRRKELRPWIFSNPIYVRR